MNVQKQNRRHPAIQQAIMQTLEERRLYAATPALDYSTYFGGTGDDFGHAVAVDAAGNTYVAGSTTSSSGVASGGADTTYSGGIFSGDALLAKFDASGKLAWSTYLGGGYADYDDISAISLDNDGNVYVAGTTSSTGWVSGGYDTTLNGTNDGFVAKFSASGKLQWSTYVGGSGDDRIADLHVTGKGAITVVGETTSTDLGSGGFDTTNSGGSDGFIARLTTAGKLSYASYIGGTGTDKANSVAMGIDGSLFVAGETDSPSGFIAGGYDTSFGGSRDGFVFQVKPDASKGWSTYLGGADMDKTSAIAVAQDGQLVVGGGTDSAGWISGGYDTTFSSWDAYVARLTATGQHVWSTYMGGVYLEGVNDIAIASDGTIGAVGYTGGGTWVSNGPDLTENGGSNDGFAVELTSAGQHKWSTFIGGDDIDQAYGVAFDAQNRLLVAGATDSAGWTVGGKDLTRDGSTDFFLARYSVTEPFISVANGTATIGATDGNDDINVSIVSGKLKVTRNGTTQQVPSSGISRIEIFAGAGNDRVIIQPGTPAAYIAGEAGNDTLQGGDGNDTLSGGGGRNMLLGGAGDDRLNGSTGPDLIYGQNGADRIYSYAGDDVIDGGNQVDHIWGGDGNDNINGGASNDYVYGEAGNDSLNGGAANDVVDGGASADKIAGDEGNDTLYGGGGNDRMEGGIGNDSLRGGAGNDALMTKDSVTDILKGDGGTDTAQSDAGDTKSSVEAVLA